MWARVSARLFSSGRRGTQPSSTAAPLTYPHERGPRDSRSAPYERRLTKVGVLSNTELLNDLNMKRSSLVIGLLAEFPDVVVRSTRPIVIEQIGQPTTIPSESRETGTSGIPSSPVAPKRYVPRVANSNDPITRLR
jgi:hypothetical protein